MDKITLFYAPVFLGPNAVPLLQEAITRPLTPIPSAIACVDQDVRVDAYLRDPARGRCQDHGWQRHHLAVSHCPSHARARDIPPRRHVANADSPAGRPAGRTAATWGRRGKRAGHRLSAGRCAGCGPARRPARSGRRHFQPIPKRVAHGRPLRPTAERIDRLGRIGIEALRRDDARRDGGLRRIGGNRAHGLPRSPVLLSGVRRARPFLPRELHTAGPAYDTLRTLEAMAGAASATGAASCALGRCAHRRARRRGIAAALGALKAQQPTEEAWLALAPRRYDPIRERRSAALHAWLIAQRAASGNLVYGDATVSSTTSSSTRI